MSRHRLPVIDLSSNAFELFRLPRSFAIDLDALDRAYRALQGEVHPDKFAAGTDTERRIAMQSAARVNEAYRILKDPVARAYELLALRGAPVEDETDTRLDLDFLERQLERREQASEAMATRDERALGSIHDGIRAEMAEREAQLRRLLDVESDPEEARAAVRELRFLAKVASDIDAMIAEVDA